MGERKKVTPVSNILNNQLEKVKPYKKPHPCFFIPRYQCSPVNPTEVSSLSTGSYPSRCGESTDHSVTRTGKPFVIPGVLDVGLWHIR